MNVRIEDSWKQHLQTEFDKPYFEALTRFVRGEYAAHTVYPPGKQMFAAFDVCPFDAVKVVILGQDPYHEPGQAHGLCFSVNDGVPFPPSLQNIFKEIENDLVSLSLPPATCYDGLDKEYCYSTLPSQYGLIKPAHTKIEAGRSLPMP